MRTEEVIDACVFHEWASVRDLAPYMSAGWRELILRPGDPAGPNQAVSNWRYRSPIDPKSSGAYPASGPAGSSPELLIQQVLDEGGRSRAVLAFDEGLLATAHANHYLARLMTRAANDWTVEHWLSRDRRLHALILVSTALPDQAAAEVRRLGDHEQMVGVALGANGLSRPFGHPVYHPIYEAAAELGLPVVIQVGSDAATDMLTKPVAGGLPATYAEYKVLGVHPSMTHVASMIGQGVFDLFPSLKVLLVGGGATWIPAYLWRFDYWFHINGREAPWLTRLPSEYFLEHVRVATYSLERPPEPTQLTAALTSVPGIERSLVYASCYPNADGESPEECASRLPSEWRAAVLEQNARDLFRWPGAARPTAAPARDIRTSLIEQAAPALPTPAREVN